MNLPLEILQPMLRYVEPRDRFNCLTVCRQWCSSVKNHLHVEAQISSFDNFIKFVDRVKYCRPSMADEVISIKLVNTIYWGLETTGQREYAIKSRFLTIALCCVNLQELDFDSPVLWNCLYLIPVAWERTWLKLTKLPPYDSEAADTVYRMFKHRLTSAKLVWPGETTINMIRILLKMQQLESLELGQDNYISIARAAFQNTFNFYLWKEIHTSLPKLKHLSINCPISNRCTDSAILPPLAFLKSFSCSIRFPEAVWFRIIKANFSRMTDLDVNITIVSINHYSLGAFIHEITNLYKQLEVRKISISLKTTDRNLNINNFLRPIIHMTELIQPEISVTLDIYDRITSTILLDERYRISSTRRKNKDEDTKYTVRHDLQIKYILPKDIVVQTGEIAPLCDIVDIPLCNSLGKLESSLDHVVELTLKRSILWCDYACYELPVNYLLAEFPQLQCLSVSSENDTIHESTQIFLSPEDEEYNYKFNILGIQPNRKRILQHKNLKTIRLEHMCLGSFVFELLTNLCPNLKYIRIINCVWDYNGKNTKVGQESLLLAPCKKRNITLYIE